MAYQSVKHIKTGIANKPVAIALLTAFVFVILFGAIAIANAATILTASITNITTGGVEQSISCKFVVTSYNTVEVSSGASKTPAIDASTTGTIVIPESITVSGNTYKVTGIGDYAFSTTAVKTSCRYLTSVECPDTITYIGAYAFCACTGLKDFSFGSSVTEIKDHAFYYCLKLVDPVLPNTLTSIESYAFSRCAAIRTLEFLGDAPTIGNYAFTGGGVQITSVIYHGTTADGELEDLFNSDTVDSPKVYYSIDFYASKSDAAAKGEPLSTAVIQDTVKIGRVSSELNNTSVIFSGSIPDYPSETNLWCFDSYECYTSYNNTLTQGGAVYAIESNVRDLSLGSITQPDVKYTNLDSTLDMVVNDALGLELERDKDFTVSLERKDSNGDWVASSDYNSPGKVRVTATAKKGSVYKKSVSKEYEIILDDSCTFLTSMPVYQQDSETGEWLRSSAPTLVWVNVVAIDGNNISVGIATGNPDIKKKNAKGEEYRVYQRALLSKSISGMLYIPDSIKQVGYTLTVTQIDSDAFGYNPYGDDGYACSMKGVSFSKNIVSIGSNAFRNIGNLNIVEFRADANDISVGNLVFDGTSVSKVLWRGKKNNYEHLFTSNPVNYYTVKYYSSREAVATEEPIGTALLSEKVELAMAPQTTTLEDGLYDGAVPAYPDEYIDDGEWYAPIWTYPEVNLDNTVALCSTLSDSCYAYAAQTNDPYSLVDCMIKGIEDGQEFEYNGSAVLDRSSIYVRTILGETLTYGEQFDIVFSREDYEHEGVWNETDDITNGGTVRLTVVGKGKYSGSRSIEFKINAEPTSDLTSFTSTIEFQLEDGTIIKDYEATYTILGGNKTDGWEVSFYGTGGTHTYTDAEGVLHTEDLRDLTGVPTVPASVMYRGVNYKVTTLDARAFSNCTTVKLPNTITLVKSWAFSYSTLTLTELSFGDNVTFKANSLYGLLYLTSLEYGENCTFEANALADISNFKAKQNFTFLIRASATFATGAFDNSYIKNIEFEDGIEDIPAEMFVNVGTSQLRGSVKLPSTLKTIGENAFANFPITEITFPSTLESIGVNAFTGCNQLTKVVFEGDVDTLKSQNQFAAVRKIDTVVFYGKSLSDYNMFSYSNPTYYSAVSFYASKEQATSGDGEKLGTAIVRIGASLADINENKLATADLYEGEIPSLPDGTNIWGFEGDTPLYETLEGSCYAYARSVDLTDLSLGSVVIANNGEYRYRGYDLDPVAEGDVTVYNVSGRAADASLYSTVYQRFDQTDQAWKDTNDTNARGCVNIVATASSESGYHGACSNYFVIATYLTGDTFKQADMNGNEILYKVTSIASDIFKGEVSVGTGSSVTPAVASSTEGVVVIPEVAKDPLGWSYDPVSVSANAFYRCMGVTSIIIPSSVTSIGSKAFAYENVKTDTKTSGLNTIIFNCDMNNCSIESDAFLNCDVLKNVVYHSKRGTFSEFGPNSSAITFYLTAYYYNSKADMTSGNVKAAVVVKEKSTLSSLSKTDYFTVSDQVPELEEDYEWYYQESCLDSEGRITDTLNVYSTSALAAYFTAPVSVVASDGSTSSVDCTFSYIFSTDDQHEYTEYVAVGMGEEGNPAVSVETAGMLVIPETVEDANGDTFKVLAIADSAFGSSVAKYCCTGITAVKLPASLSQIGQAAFMGCNALEAVEFASDNNITSIGSNAFNGCLKLSKFEFNEGLNSIGGSAFKDTALTTVKLPSTLSSLGKAAFDNCTSLKEVRFAGPTMNLALPGDSGADSTGGVAQGADSTATSNASRLTMIDDYTFEGCTALKRVVFNANCENLVISNEAFEGCASIESIIFGDVCPAELPSFGNSTPTIYLTLSYFDDDEAVAAFERKGVTVFESGATFDTLSDHTLFAQEMEIPEYYEFVYPFEATEELTNSQYATTRLKVYALNTDDVDEAFEVSLTCEGAEITESTYNKTIDVSVSSDHAVQPGEIRVLNEAGETIATFDSNGGSFVMPASDISIEVDPALTLTVEVVPLKGETKTYSFTIDELTAMATDARSDSGRVLNYTAWNNTRSSSYMRSDLYVDFDTLCSAVGFKFDDGDSIVCYSGEEMVSSLSYTRYSSGARKYFPGIKSGSTDGATDVKTVLALRSAETGVAIYNASGEEESGLLEPSYAGACSLLMGQTKEEYMTATDTLSLCGREITTIRVILGATNLSDCTISGLPSYVNYTGDALEPEFTITDEFGNTLDPGVDFEYEYSNNTNAGTATITCTGIGVYRGSISTTFNIRRSSVVAASNAAAMSADAAFDAYPSGAKGAVIASSKSLTDVMTATSLSALLNYPLILNEGKSLTSDTSSTLGVLSSGVSNFKVVVVGSTESISTAAFKSLASTYGTNRTTRLGGSTAEATSATVYSYGSHLSNTWGKTAVVAPVEARYAAASVVSFAASLDAPVFFVKDKTASSSTLSALASGGFETIILAGTTSYLPSSILSGANLSSSTKTVRISGTDYFNASKAAVSWAVANEIEFTDVVTAKATDTCIEAALCVSASKPSIMVLTSAINQVAIAALPSDDADITYHHALGTGSTVASKSLIALGWKDGTLSLGTIKPAGSTFTVGKATYKVTTASSTPKVSFIKTTATGAVSIPKTVKYNGDTYTVTSFAASAFAGKTKITSVALNANITAIPSKAFKGCTALKAVTGTSAIKTIGSYTFSGCKKLTTLNLSTTTKLTKAGVKNSLNGSSITTIKVKSSKLKVYKTYFAKANSGKSVTVKGV